MHNLREGRDGTRFTWVIEPTLDPETKQPMLKPVDEIRCQPITKKTLDGIVKRVKKWFKEYIASYAIKK